MQILEKTNLKAYEKAKRIGPRKTINLLKKKGLKGRGGSGFPTGEKWEIVSKEKSKEKYIICNADEGEPGTFKDKFILENNPEIVIEGLLIGAYSINATEAYIYLRGEYEHLEEKLRKLIKNIKKKINSKIKINLIIGQGAYICGDETAIISSIEGKRGEPIKRPPFPTTKGLFGNPTVINNLETLANVPLAILFDKWEVNKVLYSISGDVNKPGVYEEKLGIRLSELIEKAEPKNKVKAVYFGCFGGCIPFSDIEITSENICGKECMLGAHTIIVVDETHSIPELATIIAKFYEFESCGKCTPCREGTLRVLNILENICMGDAKKEDLDFLQELAKVITETSFCGLGQTSMQHILTALKYFRKEFEEKCR